MSEPTPPAPPESDSHAVPDEQVAPDEQPAEADDVVVEVPLNRAARRGRAKEQQKPPPDHVGPQTSRSRGLAPRSHTKRRSG